MTFPGFRVHCFCFPATLHWWLKSNAGAHIPQKGTYRDRPMVTLVWLIVLRYQVHSISLPDKLVKEGYAKIGHILKAL